MAGPHPSLSLRQALIAQYDRLLKLTTILGDDMLLPQRVIGHTDSRAAPHCPVLAIKAGQRHPGRRPRRLPIALEAFQFRAQNGGIVLFILYPV